MKIIALILSSFWIISCQKSGDHHNHTHAVKDQKALSSNKIPEFQGQIDSVSLKTLLQRYYTVKNALVDGNARAAAFTAKEASNFATGGDSVLLTISDQFRLISEKQELSLQRTHFYTLSEYMFAVTSKIKPDTASIYQQYCPMAFDDQGAFWLSDEEEIYNPYFGEEMLQCGMVQKKY